MDIVSLNIKMGSIMQEALEQKDENGNKPNPDAMYLGAFMAMNSIYPLVLAAETNPAAYDALNKLMGGALDYYPEALSTELNFAKQYLQGDENGSVKDNILSQRKSSLDMYDFVQFITPELPIELATDTDANDIDNPILDNDTTIDDYNETELNKAKTTIEQFADQVSDAKTNTTIEELPELQADGDPDIDEDDLSQDQDNEDIFDDFDIDDDDNDTKPFTNEEVEELELISRLKEVFDNEEFPRLNNSNISDFFEFIKLSDIADREVLSTDVNSSEVLLFVNNGLNREYSIIINKDLKGSKYIYTYTLNSGPDNYIPMSGNLRELSNLIAKKYKFGRLGKINPSDIYDLDKDIPARNVVRDNNNQAITYANTLPVELHSISLFSQNAQVTRDYLRLKNLIFGELMSKSSTDIVLDEDTLRKVVMKAFTGMVGLNNANKLAVLNNYRFNLVIEKDTVSYPQDRVVASTIRFKDKSGSTTYYTPERLTTSIHIQDASGNYVDLSNIGVNLPNIIKLSNLRLPNSTSDFSPYAEEYYKLQSALNTRLIQGDGPIVATGLVIEANNKAEQDLLNIYQPPQYYNGVGSEVNQYRLHINESYRIGNTDVELSTQELLEIGNNLVIMKSLGYDVHLTSRELYDMLMEVEDDFIESTTSINSMNNRMLTILNNIAQDNPALLASKDKSSVFYILKSIRDNENGIASSEQLEELSKFRELLKQPLTFPQYYHSLLLKELGFSTTESIIAQPGDFSGNSAVVYKSENTAILSKSDRYNSTPSIQSKNSNASVALTSRSKITPLDLMQESLESPESKKSLLGVTQAPYFYAQTLQYIKGLEDRLNRLDTEPITIGTYVRHENETYIVIQDNMSGNRVQLYNPKIGVNSKIVVDRSSISSLNKKGTFVQYKGKNYLVTDSDVIISTLTYSQIFEKPNATSKAIIDEKYKIVENEKKQQASKSQETLDLRAAISKAKASLFDPSNPYGLGYSNIANIGNMTKEEVETLINGNKDVGIQGIRDKILNEFAFTLRQLQETANLKGVSSLQDRVYKYNLRTTFRSREIVDISNEYAKQSNLPDTITSDITINNQDGTTDNYNNVNIEYITLDVAGEYPSEYNDIYPDKNIKLIVLNNPSPNSKKDLGGSFLIPLSSFDNQDRLIKHPKNIVTVTYTVNGQSITEDFVKIRKHWNDSKLFYSWYSVDGKYKYIGTLLPREDGGFSVATLSSMKTLEFIKYGEAKYEEFKQLETLQEQLDVINENSTRLFGSYSDLKTNINGEIIAEKNLEKESNKISSSIIVNSPNMINSPSFGDVDTSEPTTANVAKKLQSGGIRNKDILAIYDSDLYTGETMEYAIEATKELTVNIVYNPIVNYKSSEKSGISGKEVPPQIRDTTQQANIYVQNDIFPMFPHMVINLSLNQSNLYNNNSVVANRIDASGVLSGELAQIAEPINIDDFQFPIEEPISVSTEDVNEQVTDVVDTVEQDETSDVEFEEQLGDIDFLLDEDDEFLISDKDISNDNTGADDIEDSMDDIFGRLETTLADYTMSEDDILTLYNQILGINAIVIDQVSYNKLPDSKKRDNFYIIKSNNKFRLSDGLTYLGFASKGLNALHTSNDLYSFTLAKHEILHTILNEYMPATRRQKILQEVRILLKADKDRSQEYLDVDNLTNRQLEEYLVLLKESTDLGNDWRKINENSIVRFIDKTIVGKFINRILGSNNAITDFLSWIVSTYKKTINFNQSELDKFIIDLSYNRFRRAEGSYDSYNQETGQKEEPNIRGRLDSEVEAKSNQAKRLNSAFGYPHELNEETKVLNGSRRFSRYKQQIASLIVEYQFVTASIDLYKQRRSLGEIIDRVQSKYISDVIKQIDESPLLRQVLEKKDNKSDVENIFIQDYLTLKKVDRNKTAVSYKELQNISNRIQKFLYSQFDSDQFTDKNNKINKAYYTLAVLANKNEILSYMYEDIEFDAWNDTVEEDDGSIEIGSSWQAKEATHLTTLDTLSKKVKNHIYNTSYFYEDSFGNKVYELVDPKTVQDILTSVFENAQQLSRKNNNDAISALNEAWRLYLQDLGTSSPDSYSYYEARALYDKVFKIDDDFIPISPNSTYKSSYKYSYAQVAFNHESITSVNPNIAESTYKYLTKWTTKFNNAINTKNINDIKSLMTELTAVNAKNNQSRLDAIAKIFKDLNLEKEYNKAMLEYNNFKQGDNIEKLKALNKSITKLTSIVSNYTTVNQSILQLHQDAYNSVVSMFASNWKVSFSKVGVTKNIVKTHTDVGSKKDSGFNLSVKTGIINTVYNSRLEIHKENIVKQIISHTPDKSKVNTGNYLSINTLQDPRSKYKISHNKSSITFEFPYNFKGEDNVIKIVLNESDLITRGEFKDITKDKLKRIYEQLTSVPYQGYKVDIIPNVVASFYQTIGFQLDRRAVRTLQRVEGIENTNPKEGVLRLIHHMLQSYAVIQAAYEEENGVFYSRKQPDTNRGEVRGTSLLSKFVSRKDDVDINATTDSSGTRQSTLTEEGEDENSSQINEDTPYMFTPSRDYDDVLTRLIEYNKRFKQAVQKDSVYFGENRYGLNVYTTPLYEHLQELTTIEKDNIFDQLTTLKARIENENRQLISSAEGLAEIDRLYKEARANLLSEYKFMSSPIYTNRLIDMYTVNGKLEKNLIAKNWSIFNYINNSSSGKGKSFLNFTIKELQRQAVNDFFLYPGQSGNKYGAYNSARHNEYKQTLEAQANRGQLPIVELDSKVFYDYEKGDESMFADDKGNISNNLVVSKYKLGADAESKLFNVYSSSNSYMYNTLKETETVLGYESNSDLGIGIDTTYLNKLMDISIDVNAKLAEVGNNPLKVFLEFKRLVNLYKANSENVEYYDEVRQITTNITGFEVMAINNIDSVIEQIKNKLSKASNPTLIDFLNKTLQEYTSVRNNPEQLSLIAGEYSKIYKEAYLNRLKESYLMANQYMINDGFGDPAKKEQNAKILNGLRQTYIRLDKFLEKPANTLDGFDNRYLDAIYKRLGDIGNNMDSAAGTSSEVKDFIRYEPLPSETLSSAISRNLSRTAQLLNDQLAVMSKANKNKLMGQLTLHRHYDKTSSIFSINGLTGFTLSEAIQRLPKDQREKSAETIKSFVAIERAISKKNLTIDDIIKVANNNDTIHDEVLSAIANDIKAGNPNIQGPDINNTKEFIQLYNNIKANLEANGITSVKSTKAMTIGQLLYEDVTKSFSEYIKEIKEEMVRFGLQAVQEEVEITGIISSKYDSGVMSYGPKRNIDSNNRYDKAFIDNFPTYFELDPNTGSYTLVEHRIKPIEYTINGKKLYNSAGKKFIYDDKNSNSGRKYNDQVPTVNPGSFLFFSNTYQGSESREERLSLFKQLPIDDQLDNINPIFLDYFLTNKVNGFYLGQYIDGDIYRYKGKTTTAKLIDMVKRIGTNTTPGTKPTFREVISLNNKQKTINNNGLSTHHNVANIPDEVYDIMNQEYKYFRDVSALTYDDDNQALKSIVENMIYHGEISATQAATLTVGSLDVLKIEDSSSKYNRGIYVREGARYGIDTSIEGNPTIILLEEGSIRGRSGELLDSFEAWDGVTFMSNLAGLLIINSYGNKEGIDMTQQGLKMINNNLDAKTQNGVSMKSLQVKFTSKFIFNSSESVKTLVKEGYRSGILNEDFIKDHTYKKGTNAIINGEEVVLNEDLSIQVPDGEWNLYGEFVPPQLNLITDKDGKFSWNIPSRKKTLYDVYWENGGWNPNQSGVFETVYFDGSTTAVDSEQHSTLKISKSDFEVYKAYIKNREDNAFMVKDKSNNTLLTLDELLGKIKNNDSNYSDLLNRNINTIQDLIKAINVADRFVYMDSVMLFNPASGTKKGTRDTNPNFKGNYSDEFTNIHTQSLENFSYIITINKKDKDGQDVALSTQFTYLLGMENNVFEAQDVYNVIASLSKEQRKDFEGKIKKIRNELLKSNSLEKIKETLNQLNGKRELNNNLSPQLINLITTTRLENMKLEGRLTAKTLNTEAERLLSVNKFSTEEINFIADSILDSVSVKKYMMEIVRSNAEASAEFNQVWEHVSNQENLDEMTISNPVLFNKLFSDVAARVSKGMALRVNGKKAVQMPITQMKKVYEWNGRLHTKLDIFNILKAASPNKSNTTIYKQIDDLIRTRTIKERSVSYGNPNQDTDKITHTEVEASNPFYVKYSFLKDISLREMFDIYDNNRMLRSLESKTYEDINTDSLALEEYLNDLVDGGEASTLAKIYKSPLFKMLKADVNDKIQLLERSKKIDEYLRKQLINNPQAVEEARELYKSILEDKLSEYNDRLQEEENPENRESIKGYIQTLEQQIKDADTLEDAKLISYLNTSVKFNKSKLIKLTQYMEFLNRVEKGRFNTKDGNISKLNNDFVKLTKRANKALYGIMSRVPNTGLNSNSFFKIVTFNNEYGNSVFIPAEWLNISGSDHDGDTLQLWTFDPYGRNKYSDLALEKAADIMTKYDNTASIFSKLDLSLKPIQDEATKKYNEPGMYLKPYDAHSFFTVVSQNAVGSTVVGSSALLGKNYTYANQVIKSMISYISKQEDLNNVNRLEVSKGEEIEVQPDISNVNESLEEIDNEIIQVLFESVDTQEELMELLDAMELSTEEKGEIIRKYCMNN